MRNFGTNIVQRWGQVVHNICTTCGLLSSLSPLVLGRASGTVHKSSDKALSLPLVLPLVMHSFFMLLQSVIVRLMLIVHSTYKENNKSKILKSHYLYTGGF